MNFNYPGFLWALGLLAIPVLIHLFNFRRARRVYYSSVRLLKLVRQETTQKRRIKKYLILASRLLFMFFLVMAFAQPFLPASESATAQNNLVIYLDNSYSMSAPIDNQLTALEGGVSVVRELVNVFPPETKFRLITNDFFPFSNTYKTRVEMEELLAQVKPTTVSRTWAEVTARINENNVNLFWVSDFQRATLGEVTPPNTAWSVRLVPVTGAADNVWIDSVYLDRPWMVGEQNNLTVRFRNGGNNRVAGMRSRLTINGVQMATATVQIEPNSVSTTQFDLMGQGKRNRVVISFSDYPVSFDNTFYVALNTVPPLNIVEVKGTGATAYVEKVYGNREVFKFRSFPSTNPDYAAFTTADVVVLHGVDQPDQLMTAALLKYKQGGGRILIIPSLSPPPAYTHPLLSRTLTAVPNANELELAVPDFANPFYQHVFEARDRNILMPAATRVWDWGPNPGALLKCKDGAPFLSRYGNVFILASPLHDTKTDFYNNALYVPVMYRLATIGRKSFQQLYHRLSSPWITAQVDSLAPGRQVKLTGANEIIPSQSYRGDRLLMELPRQMVVPGFYNLVLTDTLDLLAFNADKAESDMATYPAADLMALLGGGDQISYFEPGSVDDVITGIRERYVGRPLWKYALLASLLFILIEILLIRFLK